MKKSNISGVLGERLNISELNSKTLAYRVNGLICACNITVENRIPEKTTQIVDDIYASGLIYNHGKDNQCAIYALKRQDEKKGDYISIVADTDDLSFAFDNYIGKKNIDRKIVEIPFYIFVNKIYSGLEYIISIESISGQEVKFTFIEEDGHRFSFYANIIDFSKILNIVKSFVNNPEEVVRTYDEILNQKRISFTNGDLNKAIEYDEQFEKPVNGMAKRLRLLTNNEINYKKPKNDSK